MPDFHYAGISVDYLPFLLPPFSLPSYILPPSLPTFFLPSSFLHSSSPPPSQVLLLIIRIMDDVKDFEKDKVIHPDRWVDTSWPQI